MPMSMNLLRFKLHFIVSSLVLSYSANGLSEISRPEYLRTEVKANGDEDFDFHDHHDHQSLSEISENLNQNHGAGRSSSFQNNKSENQNQIMNTVIDAHHSSISNLDLDEIIPRKLTHSYSAFNGAGPGPMSLVELQQHSQSHNHIPNFSTNSLSPISLASLSLGEDGGTGTGAPHTAYTVNNYAGAPDCKVDADDVFSCARTLEEQVLLKNHLDRRSVVAFLFTVWLCIVIWVCKWIFHVRKLEKNWTLDSNNFVFGLDLLYFQTQSERYLNVMFTKCLEQVTCLGVIVGICLILERTNGNWWHIDEFFFPDKPSVRFSLRKYASNDIREGVIHPEIVEMFSDLHLLVAGLMFVYTMLIVFVSIVLSLRFRKWARFELETENEVHVQDDPVEKINFLLWRRSLLSPMIGQISEDLSELRNPVREFSFTTYLQEVSAQFFITLFHIPTLGLILVVMIAAIECSLQIQSKTKGNAVLSFASMVWVWVIAGVVWVFRSHVRWVTSLVTPPPAAMLWYLEKTEGDSPPKHMLPPYRLLPYLKEAPKKSRFFLWWYGTFSPNQQEQLFFRWRKGPATILNCLQVCLFITAVFMTVVIKHLYWQIRYHRGVTSFSFTTGWISLVGVLYIALVLIPEAFLDLLICSSTGILANRRAIKAVVKEHRDQHELLARKLLELAQISAIKEHLESPDTAQQTTTFFADLFEVVFSPEERELFDAGYRIHSWGAGLNPSELKECLEHLGLTDVEASIAEWWTMFDRSASGVLNKVDFYHLLTARHVVRHGHIYEGDLEKLLSLHPDGSVVESFDVRSFSDFLISFQVEEPHLGALLLIREARYLADQKLGKSLLEIQTQLGPDSEMNKVSATPQELASFLVTKQNNRTKFDSDYIQWCRDRRKVDE